MPPEPFFVTLSTPDSFPSFPYDPPYPIQIKLMQHVYASIEDSTRKVAVVESPTGTGKTLSLLCSTLTWLADSVERANKTRLESFRASLKDDGDPDWVHEQTLAAHLRQLEAKKEEFEERLASARRREEELKRRAMAKVVRKRPKVEKENGKQDDDDDTAFLPENETADEDGISPEVKALMKRLAESRRKDEGDEVQETPCTKLLKTSLSTRVVPLGSRMNLCINEELRAKGNSATELDEGCRELLNGKHRERKRCPYLPLPEEEHRMLEFRDHVLAAPKDIEDLVTLGKELSTCPYFGSRRAIPQAELVALPYNLLLQKSARKALGIDLTGHVVVIDEAHNTLLSIYAAPLSVSTLATSIVQLTAYLERFKKKLTALHALHLRRLLRFLVALRKFLENWRSTSSAPIKEEVMNVNKLMDALGPYVEGINLLEIEAYLKSSKIARKISGYCNKEAEKTAQADSGIQSDKLCRRSTPPLHSVEAFIVTLSNANTVDAARCVVLAGGTMSPMSDLQFQLFPFLSSDQYSIYTCGHVIPSSNLQTIVVAKGPKGGDLTFKFEQRDNVEMLGQVLSNLVNLIPHGLVVFFPSYAFLNTTKKVFNDSGLLERLNGKKKPESSSEVDNVLREYAIAISSIPSVRPFQITNSNKGGALLFAVIGAKLSEGINFSDSLARGVVVVGLPFPSLASVELKERMRYVSELEKTLKLKSNCSVSVGHDSNAKDAGMELYENICMRSVNQSIGRAIRHKNDYATLVLVDSRYASPRIQAKLPVWIGKDCTVAGSFGDVVRDCQCRTLLSSNASVYRQQLDTIRPLDTLPYSNTLGVLDRIYVINLPARDDRRRAMMNLESAMDIKFTWHNATFYEEDVVRRIMGRLGKWRIENRVNREEGEKSDLNQPFTFKWNEDVFDDASNLGIRGADLWTLEDTSFAIHSELLDAYGEDGLRYGKTPLRPSQVACWNSHYNVLRRVAEGTDDVALILEDDVDMEWDLERRLRLMWPFLPHDWDVVLLGHCMSRPFGKSLAGTPTLFPATQSLCSHGYVVNRRSASRLVRFLRSESFAYSRAIDHAINHLSTTGKLKTFTVNPPVIIQPKELYSDLVHPGFVPTREQWLSDSALERVALEKNLREMI
ncbi:hypothetical protein Clacol_007390 [Clathrus columnatus]|uniref:ATP-dependent DNA helicase CHL1 n=1 Tax=Clathrus columnatus TaxID=1419009 RepID=A0AAV5AFR1_9AGAM|nr:hypothetical protein Clacol_007390 [Clathrus columnatus]